MAFNFDVTSFFSSVTEVFSGSSISETEPGFPPEFVALIIKVKNIKSFKEFNSVKSNSQSNRRYTIVPSRNITVASDGENNIYIKSPTYKTHFRNKFFAKQEQLAFLISHRLNFNIVPTTLAIEGYEDAFNKNISEKNRGLFNSFKGDYQGTVIQESVKLHPHHSFSDKKIMVCGSDYMGSDLDKSEIDKLLIRDKEKALTFCKVNLDMNQIFKAIFFNIITGRRDATQRNSEIDSSNRIIELDNEYIGFKNTHSWLLDFFSGCVVSKEVINELVSKDISVIENVFKDMAHFPSFKFWNSETEQFDIVDNTENNIKNNFQKLKNYLLENRNSEISVLKLKELFSPSPDSSIRIQFETKFGQSLVICGSGAKKLDWDPQKAISMTWNPGNIWKIILKTKNKPIVFKILLKEENGQCKWMDGDNLEIKPGRSGTISQISFQG